MASKRNTIPAPDQREERKQLGDTIYRLACVSTMRDQWEIRADGAVIARTASYADQKRAFDAFLATF